jgi:hypothetical protein
MSMGRVTVLGLEEFPARVRVAGRLHDLLFLIELVGKRPLNGVT